MDNETTPTPEQIEEYCQKLIEELKEDPDWELRQEFGKMLMRNVDSFSDEERCRYAELERRLNKRN